MAQAAFDMGGFDTRDLDASAGRMRRVLTLIHDKAPTEQIDPELDEMERARADLVLRFEAEILSRLSLSLTEVEGGVPIKPDVFLDGWARFEKAAPVNDLLKLSRRLKSQIADAHLRRRLNRFLTILEQYKTDRVRIGNRLKAEVKRLTEIETGNTPGRQSALMYMAALSRRGVEPKLLDFDVEDGLVTPIVGAVPPAALAVNPSDLLAFEDSIHEEVERAAPHLMGRTVIWWTDADATA